MDRLTRRSRSPSTSVLESLELAVGGLLDSIRLGRPDPARVEHLGRSGDDLGDIGIADVVVAKQRGQRVAGSNPGGDDLKFEGQLDVVRQGGRKPRRPGGPPASSGERGERDGESGNEPQAYHSRPGDWVRAVDGGTCPFSRM